MAVVLTCSNVFVNVFTLVLAILDFKGDIVDKNAHHVHFVTSIYHVENQYRSNFAKYKS